MVPGVNPPAGIESDEIILATWGLAAGDFGDSAVGDSTVGIWESELIGCPQELQKLLPCGFCAEHFGHGIDGGVIGFSRTPPIICDQVYEEKHISATGFAAISFRI
jgi:hypothetical protein